MMVSNRENFPTDSAETLRDVVGADPTATFEDDPTFVASNPTGSASSENLGAAADDDDDDVDEDDLAEEGDLDQDFEDEDDDEDQDDEDFDDGEDEDDEDDADEAGVSAAELRARDDGGDDDVGDDGRENAVNEDDLNAEVEANIEGDDSSLTPVEVETLRKRMEVIPVSEVPGRRAGM